MQMTPPRLAPAHGSLSREVPRARARPDGARRDELILEGAKEGEVGDRQRADVLEAGRPKRPEGFEPRLRAGGDRLEALLGMPRRVALHPGVWAVFAAHAAFNFGAHCRLLRGAVLVGPRPATAGSSDWIRRREAAPRTQEKRPGTLDPIERPRPLSQWRPMSHFA